MIRRAAFALAACALSCSGGSRPAPASWRVVVSGQRSTLLSVWGTSASDVFAVGGPLGDGSPSTVLRFDGSAWRDLDAGGTETFWWVHGTAASDVWAVGEKGRIVHWNGSAFAEAARSTTATLYGVWTAAPDDVWVVGGSPEQGSAAPNDVCLHFDGKTWDASLGPMRLGRAFFKVWGTSSSNLYVVGEAATIWHRRGTRRRQRRGVRRRRRARPRRLRRRQAAARRRRLAGRLRECAPRQPARRVGRPRGRILGRGRGLRHGRARWRNSRRPGGPLRAASVRSPKAVASG